MGLTTLGLVLDGIGAVLLVVPDLPKSLRRFLIPIFPRARTLESARAKLSETTQLTIDDDETELKAFYPWLDKAYALNGVLQSNPAVPKDYSVNGVKLNGPHVSITIDNGESHNVLWNSEPRRVKDRIIDRALERYFVHVGVFFLVVGFVFQIVGQ